MDIEFKYAVNHPHGRYGRTPGEAITSFVADAKTHGTTVPKFVKVQTYKRRVDNTSSWEPVGDPVTLMTGETGVSDQQLELPLPTPDGEPA